LVLAFVNCWLFLTGFQVALTAAVMLARHATGSADWYVQPGGWRDPRWWALQGIALALMSLLFVSRLVQTSCPASLVIWTPTAGGD
jgi:hypothetical protein